MCRVAMTEFPDSRNRLTDFGVLFPERPGSLKSIAGTVDGFDDFGLVGVGLDAFA